jgi:hypothetical protein
MLPSPRQKSLSGFAADVNSLDKNILLLLVFKDDLLDRLAAKQVGMVILHPGFYQAYIPVRGIT